LRASITSDECHNLLGHGAQRYPNPALILLVVHERPKLIKLEHAVFRLWWRDQEEPR
jgi:hypothetical protein